MTEFKDIFKERLMVKPLRLNQEDMAMELKNPTCDTEVLVDKSGDLYFFHAETSQYCVAKTFVFFQKSLVVYEWESRKRVTSFRKGIIRDLPGRIKNVSENEFRTLVFLCSKKC